MIPKQENENPEMMSKNPKYWKGPFYFNPKDPNLTVPKFDTSMGWGSTLNFGKIQIQIAIIAIILIPIIYKMLF